MSRADHIIHILHHLVPLFFFFEIDRSPISYTLGEDARLDGVLGRVAVNGGFFFLAETRGVSLFLRYKHRGDIPIDSTDGFLVSLTK
jgi:hypothetical protein